MRSGRFLALSSVVEVRCAPPCRALLDGLLGTYPTSDLEPGLLFVVDGDAPNFRIWLNDNLVVDELDVFDVVPHFERTLYRKVVEAEPGVCLHAAAVVVEGRALVMVGPSGAGKTTLTRALLERGARYLSEECVAIREGGRVFGLSRPLHMERKPDHLPVGFTVAPYEWVDASGAHRRSALVAPPPEKVDSGPVELGAFTLIAFRPDGVGSRRRIGAGDALSRIWQQVMSPTAEAMAQATDFLASVSVFEVRSSTPSEGAEFVLDSLEGH